MESLDRERRMRLLDILFILAVAFWLPHFWLVERVVRKRSRSQEFRRGGGGDDEKRELRVSLSLPYDRSPSDELQVEKFKGTSYG